MNVLTRTQLEVKIGDRTYKFECSPESPLEEINHALVQMNSYVVERIHEAQRNYEAQNPKVESLPVDESIAG